ncbi:hypothetical protein EVAR_86209_1 [Eumeta japonica]|uniref:Uncharacterized protein n=1 Tax=Eumeta variegata TaxID=151549 RepID=A0A4C1UD42_EUMVA|nr:hypothetical protein EVAR_86209_1 [Eumeta japonica]
MEMKCDNVFTPRESRRNAALRPGLVAVENNRGPRAGAGAAGVQVTACIEMQAQKATSAPGEKRDRTVVGPRRRSSHEAALGSSSTTARTRNIDAPQP